MKIVFGVKNMRVELSEKAMYQRMDWKERLQLMVLISSMVLCAGMMLAAIGTADFTCLLILCSAGAVLLASALLSRKISKLIMPVTGCYLEIRDTRFFLQQPLMNG